MPVETLTELLTVAHDFRAQMGRLVHGIRVPGGKEEAAAALLRVAFAHYYSIVWLLSVGQRVSALALMRPCSDAAQRSLYLHLRGTDDVLRKLESRSKHAFGKQDDMVAALHQDLGFPVFKAVHDDHGMMSDWTHGGTDQIVFQMPDGSDEPMRENISDAECYCALTQITWPLVYVTYHLHCAWTNSTQAASGMLQDYFRTVPFPLEMFQIMERLHKAAEAG